MVQFRVFFPLVVWCAAVPRPRAGRVDGNVLRYTDCAGQPGSIEDGRCDEANNNADCGYDGGDCCECTCAEGLEYPCGGDGGGGNAFLCRDPTAGCEPAVPPAPPLRGQASTPSPPPGGSNESTASPSSLACGGIVLHIGDGICDAYNNDASCGYDGGDCCRCTCGAKFGCGSQGFDCLDPDATRYCIPETPAPLAALAETAAPVGTAAPVTPECSGDASSISNGYCDFVNNNPECGYDGGDCCECTCVHTLEFLCGNFECIDPSAAEACVTLSPTPTPDDSRQIGADSSAPESGVSSSGASSCRGGGRLVGIVVGLFVAVGSSLRLML